MDQYIFILSAMRSGSTLLQHIVGQPEFVLSAGETKIEYHSEEDLGKLKSHLLEFNGLPEDQADQYQYLEKCVHPRYLEKPLMPEQSAIRYLFITRDPISALSSLLEQKDWPYTESVAAAAWYYEDRLKALVRLAEAITEWGEFFFVTYEDLLENQEKHLQRLTRFLEFDEQLTDRYPIQRWTSILSLGDVSQNIRATRIIKNKRTKFVDLPAETEASLREVHAWANSRLSELCKSG